MWMPKDTATWLAIITLILVVPFNFFSTWAYPKLQDWWAARSRKSLKRRIDKLTESLAKMYEGRMLSIGDEWVLICAERLAPTDRFTCWRLTASWLVDDPSASFQPASNWLPPAFHL